jgi:heat shock protein HtpX
MKRVMLFLVTNIAVMLVLSIVYQVVLMAIGPEALAEFSRNGINFGVLAIWALVFGMGGALISLLMSKPMAKWATHATVIDGSEGPSERWLVDTVRQLSERAGVKMPEVAIYPGEANAFATGAFKNSALVAVSTKIMEQMSREELKAVLGHEMSHVANGDMVTLTLVQGVLNACVLFLARVIGYVAEGAISGDRGRRRGSGGVYFLVYDLMQFLLGIGAALVVNAFSRRREYAADRGSAELLVSPAPMIAALRRLGNLQPGVLPDSLKAMGISGKHASLFATHPSLEDRIAALEKLQLGL